VIGNANGRRVVSQGSARGRVGSFGFGFGFGVRWLGWQ